jgi:uncharacterized protein
MWVPLAVMRRLTPADYRRVPWRNGAGTTTELLVEPPGDIAAGGRFHYRVSIADVANDGPFSRFDGYDRHIMLLSGAGMTLDCGVFGGIDLTTPYEPRCFPGDWVVRGSLKNGPVRDFNLIVDRARASSSLGVLDLTVCRPMTFARGTIAVVYVISGTLEGAAEGDTLVADVPFDLVPQGTARLAVALIVERSV